MEIVQKPGTMSFDDDDSGTYTLATSLGHHDLETDTLYILDDEGLKSQFGDLWEEIKQVCLMFYQKLVERKYNTLTHAEILRYYETLWCILWDDTLKIMSKEKAKQVIDIVFKDKKYKKDNTMLSKVLLGGDSTPQQLIKPRKDSQG